MPKLELLVGTIASGKSTYSKKRAKEGAVIINDDSLVTALHGGDYKLYRSDFKPLYKSVEQSILALSLLNGRDVVVDRPNLTKDSRAKYLAIARAMEFESALILFPFTEPRTHALRRASHDMRGYTFEYWNKVAEAHISQYEPPEIDECYTYVTQMGVEEAIEKPRKDTKYEGVCDHCDFYLANCRCDD